MRSSHLLAPAIALVIAAVTPAAASQAHPTGAATAGSPTIAAVVPRRTDLRDLGRAPASTRVALALTLTYRHAAELEQLVRLQGDRRSPLFHRFLSNDQFDAYFAPSASDYARTETALVRAGFRISGTFRNRTIVDAVAPAAVAERYFATEIHTVVQAGAGVRYTNAKPALVPTELRGIVTSISGLSNILVAKPTFVFADPAVRAERLRLAAIATHRAARSVRPPSLRVRPQSLSGRHVDATNVVSDPGFESGGFTSWSQCGNVSATIESQVRHSGTYAEQAGSTAGEPNTDAGLCQGVAVPTGGKLTFFTSVVSTETDTTYAYAWALLLDANGNILKTLFQTVANTNGFVQRSFDISSYAGKTVYLYFGVHGDGYGGAYTIQYVDDVSVTNGSTATPTPKPSASPTPKPSASPTVKPTATPTPKPSSTPTGGGTGAPIAGPTTGPDTGYGPRVTASGYDLPVQHGYNGSGHATGIAISGDYSDTDLTAYLNYFGIKRTGPTTRRVEVDGGATYDPTYSTSNASLEATLDVETIVGNAPGTALSMYLFPDLSSKSIEDGYNQAVSDGIVDVVNSSFGGCETGDTTFDSSTNAIATQGAAKGITFAASSGDSGSNECGTGGASVSSPASDPEFVAVGGTTLTVGATGAYASEAAWSGSGGGVSSVEAEPSYQNGVSGASTAGRNVPDVAFAADPNKGTAFYFGSGGSSAGWNGPLGGTSWACPIFSALITEIDQRQGSRAGFVNPRIYKAFSSQGYGVYHDVTTGNNGAFAAKTGFDNVTGIGSAKGFGLSGNL